MLLLEHHAKLLLAERGVPVPQGWLLTPNHAFSPPGPGPWMVKAQVQAGGRGKAGGIRRVGTADEIAAQARQIGALTIGGQPVHAIRVEEALSGGHEAYLGFSVDPSRARIVVMASPRGGVDVEDHADGAMITAEAAPTPEGLARALGEVVAALPEALRPPFMEAGARLAQAFLAHELLLLEINPLLIFDNGRWVAADARVVVDENALPRQPELAAVIEANPDCYPDAAFKKAEGYDLVVVDPQGRIGLVTTGAGLSMKLIDEMTALGLRPYNFCDIRSGMMRGSPERLIRAFQRLSKAPELRCVLVNIFAGVTNLAEFAKLLLEARQALPAFDVPMVVRLAGNGEREAEEILTSAGGEMIIEHDLQKAVRICARICGETHVGA